MSALVLDGNNIPASSRIKGVLRKTQERLVSSSGGKGEDGQDVADSAKKSTGPGRVKGQTTAVSLTIDLPDSSDDEEQLARIISSLEPSFSSDGYFDLSAISAVAPSKLFDWFIHYSYPPSSTVESQLAAEPSGIWPIEFNIPKKQLRQVNNKVLFATVNSTNSSGNLVAAIQNQMLVNSQNSNSSNPALTAVSAPMPSAPRTDSNQADDDKMTE